MAVQLVYGAMIGVPVSLGIVIAVSVYGAVIDFSREQLTRRKIFCGYWFQGVQTEVVWLHVLPSWQR